MRCRDDAGETECTLTPAYPSTLTPADVLRLLGRASERALKPTLLLDAMFDVLDEWCVCVLCVGFGTRVCRFGGRFHTRSPARTGA